MAFNEEAKKKLGEVKIGGSVKPIRHLSTVRGKRGFALNNDSDPSTPNPVAKLEELQSRAGLGMTSGAFSHR